MVIDEGQQYGTDREIAVISLLQQQPLVILWKFVSSMGYNLALVRLDLH